MTNKSALYQLEEAIYNHLAANLIPQYVAAIYMHLPIQVKYPYIYMGKSKKRDWSSATSKGYKCDLIINLIEKTKSPITVAQNNDFLIETLQSTKLAMDDFVLINCQIEYSEIKLALPNDEIYQAENYVKLTMEEKSW